MKTKFTFLSWFLVFVLASLTTAVNAKARNTSEKSYEQVQLELKAARLVAQQAQTEAAYHRLLKISERSRNKSKAGFVKVAYKPKKKSKKSALETYNNNLKVTATAYTSHVDQTDSTPNIAAWGDRLSSGMKVIAVSRDLLNVYGLKHRQKVRIKGLDGEFLVLDKMNKRWKKKIDIYMGMDKKKAFQWGRRKVEISWSS